MLARRTRRLGGIARDRRGVTAIEYALIGALIVLVIVGAVSAVGTALTVPFATVAGAL